MSAILQVYSHGQSEIILGKAIKQYELPRDELVILTKVCDSACRLMRTESRSFGIVQVYFPVSKDPGVPIPQNPEEAGIINQHGLNRKVGHFVCAC